LFLSFMRNYHLGIPMVLKEVVGGLSELGSLGIIMIGL
jgi:hypothetical protein